MIFHEDHCDDYKTFFRNSGLSKRYDARKNLNDLVEESGTVRSGLLDICEPYLKCMNRRFWMTYFLSAANVIIVITITQFFLTEDMWRWGLLGMTASLIVSMLLVTVGGFLWSTKRNLTDAAVARSIEQMIFRKLEHETMSGIASLRNANLMVASEESSDPYADAARSSASGLQQLIDNRLRGFLFVRATRLVGIILEIDTHHYRDRLAIRSQRVIFGSLFLYAGYILRPLFENGITQNISTIMRPEQLVFLVVSLAATLGVFQLGIFLAKWWQKKIMHITNLTNYPYSHIKHDLMLSMLRGSSREETLMQYGGEIGTRYENIHLDETRHDLTPYILDQYYSVTYRFLKYSKPPLSGAINIPTGA
jgi:hypothetical protein